jgi:hypothetical protein
VVKIPSNKEHGASLKSANITNQPSIPTSKLSVGVHNINNKNLSELCLASNYTYLMYFFWQFFHGLTNYTYLTYFFWNFFYGSTVQVGLGLLIVEALSSYSGMEYTG